MSIVRKWRKMRWQRSLLHVCAVLVTLCDDDHPLIRGDVDLGKITLNPRRSAKVLDALAAMGIITVYAKNGRNNVKITRAGREKLRELVHAGVLR